MKQDLLIKSNSHPTLSLPVENDSLSTQLLEGVVPQMDGVGWGVWMCVLSVIKGFHEQELTHEVSTVCVLY